MALCFYKVRVLIFVGVLIVRALLFGAHIRAPHLGKLPYVQCSEGFRSRVCLVSRSVCSPTPF